MAQRGAARQGPSLEALKPCIYTVLRTPTGTSYPPRTFIGRTFIKQMALAPATPIAVEPHATRSRVGSFQSLPNENFCTTASRAAVAAQQAAHVKAISAPVWSTTTKKISLLRPTPNFYGKVLLFLRNRQQNYSFESINRQRSRGTLPNETNVNTYT